MKRALIFLLAAGPLFVFGQRPDQRPTFKSFQFAGPGRSGDTAFFRRSLTGPERPVRVTSGLPVRFPFTVGLVIREMPPDRMPCLVPLRVAEQMPMSLRGNADPLPNVLRRR
jgi:hypothetical protein